MDLFARAMRAQQARQQQQQQQHQQNTPHESPRAKSAQSRQQPQQQPQQQQQQQQQAASAEDAAEREELAEELTPEEEERQRRWKEQSDKQEGRRMAQGTARALLATLVAGGFTYAFLGIPTADDREDTFAAHHRRVVKSLTSIFTGSGATAGSGNGGSGGSDGKIKLLPDPLPEPYQRPYTLCLELNDNLVHLVWDAEHGWRVSARPGVKQLLSYLGRFYEIVIFTTSQNYIAQPVIETLDPYRYVMYSLYRDSTKPLHGKHVKDISELNRDLGKVIVVDTDPDHYQLQPENGVPLKPWRGDDPDDCELSKLTKFLEELALLASVVNLQDLRPLLRSVKQLDAEDPWRGWSLRKEQLRADFAAHERRVRGGATSARAPAVEGAAPAAAAGPASFAGWVASAASSVASSLFGRGLQPGAAGANGGGGSGGGAGHAAGAGPASAAAASAAGGGGRPVNLIDIIEQAGREEYAAFVKENAAIVAQAEEMRRKQEEEQRKQLQAMKDKKLKLVDYMLGAGATPEDSAAGTSEAGATPAPA
ncbi:mitochondrial inner membrane protein required for protein import [Cladochytrium tenue]|nr:mitochondrial inner membrane protein required for protein import [Cladochytrium tenue]